LMNNTNFCLAAVIQTLAAVTSRRLLIPTPIEKVNQYSTNKAFETPEYSPNLESSFDQLHKLLTHPSIVLISNSCFHSRIILEQLDVFNHVIQLIQNPIQCAITELVHLSLSHHLLLIIFVSVDYRPQLADYDVIFFEQKLRCIPIWLSEIKFCLITFNPELQMFHTFSDDDVPYP
ncbi:hypothetical protein Tco_1526179, partial [Tanacetum coccineum]